MRYCGLSLYGLPKRYLYMLGNLSIAIICFGVDRFSKMLVLSCCDWWVSFPFSSFCNVELAAIYGVAFIWFSKAGTAVIAISLMVATAVVAWLLSEWLKDGRECRLSCGYRVASAVLLGGILGNGVDRWCYGMVIDFIALHWDNRWYFPIFNIADVWITVGAFVLLLVGGLDGSER